MAKVIHDFSEASPVQFSSVTNGEFFKDSTGVVYMKTVPAVSGENAVNASTGALSTMTGTKMVVSLESEMIFRGSFGAEFS